MDRLLTLAEAADRLNLAESSVRRLLELGVLDGPKLPRGRRRHPRNAPRVSLASINAHMEPSPPVVETANVPSGNGAAEHKEEGAVRSGGSRSTEDGGRAAAHAMKIHLDEALDALRRERNEKRGLRKRITDLTRQLEEVTASTREVDAVEVVARGYSAALTELLAPPDASELM